MSVLAERADETASSRRSLSARRWVPGGATRPLRVLGLACSANYDWMSAVATVCPPDRRHCASRRGAGTRRESSRRAAPAPRYGNTMKLTSGLSQVDQRLGVWLLKSCADRADHPGEDAARGERGRLRPARGIASLVDHSG